MLKTLLNKVHKFKSFVYNKVYFNEGQSAIIADLAPRARSKPICSSCHKKERWTPDFRPVVKLCLSCVGEVLKPNQD